MLHIVDARLSIVSQLFVDQPFILSIAVYVEPIIGRSKTVMLDRTKVGKQCFFYYLCMGHNITAEVLR